MLKIEVKNELAGVNIFQDTGEKSYAAMLCIAEKWRNNIIGYSLFAHYLNMHIENIELFYTWVDETNEPSIALQNHFGYRDDVLKNFIFRV